MKIKRTDSNNSDFQGLVAQLDAYLAQVNGEQDEFYTQFNHIEAINHVVVAYDDQQNAIGCGAMKPYDEQSVEIKRMFVPVEYRGQGVAVAMLNTLETWAAEIGANRCILETGVFMPDAVRLYEKSGFQQIPNYGQYAGVEESICFEKFLIKTEQT